MQRIEMDRLTGPYGLLSPDSVERLGLNHTDVESFCRLSGNKIMGDAQMVLRLNATKFKRPLPPLVGAGGRDRSMYYGSVRLEQEPVRFAPFSGIGFIDALGEDCLKATYSLLGDKYPEIKWMTASRSSRSGINDGFVVEHWMFASEKLLWSTRVEEKTTELRRDDVALTALTQGVLAYLVMKS